MDEDGEWGGEFDPLSDPEERRVLFAALDSFRQYRHQTHHTTTHLRRQSFYALPSQHTALLSSPPISLLSTLDAIDAAISSNALIAERILSTGLTAFNLPSSPIPTTTDPSRNWHGAATSADLAKARTIVRQLYRDWSAAGARERRASYDPVLHDLRDEFGPIPTSKITSKPRRKPKILIPGAGLGRLVFDLSRRGYDAEGNEISYHALLAGSWVLNHTTRAEECELFPWVGTWSNHVSRRNQLRSVWVPDVCPAVAIAEAEGRDGQGSGDVIGGEEEAEVEGERIVGRGETGEMSITASDFLLLYSDAAHAECYDAVATVFFIDTAPNLLRYVETIWHCLVPGGVWVNVGPLLWHWEEGGGPTREVDGGDEEGDEDGEGRGGEDGTNSYGKRKWTGGRRRQEGIAEPGSVELTDEEVRTVVEKMGFRVEKHEVREPEAGYIQDPDSMLLNLYRVSHWVARKVG